jgi:IclR family transcriptional regulator, pca regulon regulatory protein
MSVAAPVHDGPKVVAAVNVSLQAQTVSAQPDPEGYLRMVREATLATAELISGDLTSGR